VLHVLYTLLDERGNQSWVAQGQDIYLVLWFRVFCV